MGEKKKAEEPTDKATARDNSGPLKALSRESKSKPSGAFPTAIPIIFLFFHVNLNTFFLVQSPLLSFFVSLIYSATMQAFRQSTASALRNAAAVQRRGYANAPAYAETINNLRINADTKVLFQGFTGKQGTYVIA
jgi:hypothetical protein